LYFLHPDVDLADPEWITSGVPWLTLFYKDNYPQVQRNKSSWDPRNVFHHALSIRPLHSRFLFGTCRILVESFFSIARPESRFALPGITYRYPAFYFRAHNPKVNPEQFFFSLRNISSYRVKSRDIDGLGVGVGAKMKATGATFPIPDQEGRCPRRTRSHI
jgi:hypothetical protein